MLRAARSVPRLCAFLRLQSKMDGKGVTEGEAVIGLIDAANAADELCFVNGRHPFAQRAAGAVKPLFRDEHMRRELCALTV